MNPLIVRVLQAALDDWRREADGSRTMATQYEEMAADSLRAAAEHRADADRAEAEAAAIQDALNEIQPADPGATP